MSMVSIETIIGVLRDTGAKLMETKVEEYQTFDHSEPYFRSSEPRTATREVEAYSKEWAAGRLSGLADALEAIKESGTPANPI